MNNDLRSRFLLPRPQTVEEVRRTLELFYTRSAIAALIHSILLGSFYLNAHDFSFEFRLIAAAFSTCFLVLFVFCVISSRSVRKSAACTYSQVRSIFYPVSVFAVFGALMLLAIAMKSAVGIFVLIIYVATAFWAARHYSRFINDSFELIRTANAIRDQTKGVEYGEPL